MAPIAPKRRKLEHEDSHRASLDHAPAKAIDIGEKSSSEGSLSKDAPIPSSEQARPRLKGVQDDSDAAPYAGGFYKSNMFKLQVDEMLREVKPNYDKWIGGVDDALRRLKTVIEGIEGREGLSISDATKLLHKPYKIAIPFPDPKPDKNAAYKLLYARPSRINVVGSYVLNTMVKSQAPLSIDMMVMMPSSIFQEKDYLNYRYFYKRSYYLACIAAGLQDAVQDDFSLRFEYLNGNSLHPVLIATPKIKDGSNSDFEVRIIPAAPDSIFVQSKLLPTRNSIRPKDGPGIENITPAPSPFYNSSLRSDCNFESYLKLLHSASKQSGGFQDACVLGRIWLRQRGFGGNMHDGGFGHFEWATLTALLLKGGGPKGRCTISPGYSSYQMFKGVIQFLGSTNLATKPLAFEAPDFQPSKSDEPMLYDGPRGQNILYKMTPWSYGLLREEAKTSLDMLNESTFDQFESTFIMRTDQDLHRFDCVLRMSVPANTKRSSSCDHVSHLEHFSRRIFEVLLEGLTDRVKLIDLKGPRVPSWSTRSSPPSASEAPSLLVAFVFDPANINRLVDHGPAAEEKKKAAKFQKFWGEKAELRRFKDGSILESLVWSPGSTNAIVQEIISYLIKRHFDIDISRSVDFIGNNFEQSLPGFGTSSKSFDSIREAFNSFEKDIRDLEGIPLQLRQLSAIGAQLRYSSINTPSFNTQRPLNEPADVLIEFEGSGRWPDDLVAIQRTKIAFLLKIGSLLEESNDSTTTRLGLENEDQPLQNCAFLDIIYNSGAAFRLRIHIGREKTLLERQIKDKSSEHRAREHAVSALSVYNRFFVQLPLHTQSIATHCTRFPLLSPTIRLVKMWFDSHMLSSHISEELIELLVTRTFLHPYPWRAPSSAMSGFLRTLVFISRWDWRLVPLIVDFTGTMTSKDVASINTRLEAWRKIDPGMNRTVIFAASNHDTTGTAFTDQGPSKVAATRMTALARSACKLVKEKGLELCEQSLFATATADYDFVIHLSSKYSGDHRQNDANQSRFKNLQVQSESNLELVGYEPVEQYIRELENLYSTSVVFFHSSVAASLIGGLWNPQTVSSRPFKVNLAYATKPADETGEDELMKVEIDKAAILSEIVRIGEDIVSRIEIHR